MSGVVMSNSFSPSMILMSPALSPNDASLKMSLSTFAVEKVDRISRVSNIEGFEYRGRKKREIDN